MTATPSLIEERKQLLRDYFTEHTDIDRQGVDALDRGNFCSMEHVNFALETRGLVDDSYEVHAIPSSGDFVGMATIMVAFNDATDQDTLCSDAWRLELLPRLAEATCSKVADRRRLEMIRDWLASLGFTFREQLAITFRSSITVGPDSYGVITLYDLLNHTIAPAPESIQDALGVSAEDYIGFLHTLICPAL
jgi:hypothetical protein